MTREQAQREGKKRWGKAALVRAREGLSSPEQRATASAETRQLRERRDSGDKDIQARLNALDWYQAWVMERKALVKRIEQIRWHGAYFKFAVGESNGIGFYVYGEGDTWEEAFAQADARAKAL